MQATRANHQNPTPHKCMVQVWQWHASPVPWLYEWIWWGPDRPWNWMSPSLVREHSKGCKTAYPTLFSATFVTDESHANSWPILANARKNLDDFWHYRICILLDILHLLHAVRYVGSWCVEIRRRFSDWNANNTAGVNLYPCAFCDGQGTLREQFRALGLVLGQSRRSLIESVLPIWGQIPC